MPSCVAYGCKNRDGEYVRKAGITFHRFPHSNPERLKRWIINVRRDKWCPTSNSLLCSTHFEDNCFDRTGQTVRIRADSVPTIFDFDGHQLKKNTRKLLAPECSQDSDKKNHRKKRKHETKTPSQDEISSQPENAPDTVPVHVPPRKPTEFDALAWVAAKACSNDHSYTLDTPKIMKRKLDEMTERFRQCKKKLKLEQQKTRRLNSRVQRLRELISTLKNQNVLLSNDALSTMAMDLLNHLQDFEKPEQEEDCSSD